MSDNATLNNTINKQDVIAFLQDNPDFFVENKELLTSLTLEEDTPAGVISFVDKQIEVLKTSHQQSRQQLQELTEIAKENEGYWDKLKSLCIFMLENKAEIQASPKLLEDWLVKNYQLTMAVIRLPETALAFVNQTEKTRYQYQSSDVKKDIMARINSGYSYCDNRLPKTVTQELFNENTLNIGSCAILPLNIDIIDNVRQPKLEKGIIVLADKNSERFHNHVDMTYINTLSDVISAMFRINA